MAKELNPDDVEVTLDDPDFQHTPRPMLDEQQKKMGLIAVRLAALCRLLYLKEKRDRMARSAISLPSVEGENAEFKRLEHWWSQIGRERQDKLMILAEDMAAQVLLIEAGGFGL